MVDLRRYDKGAIERPDINEGHRRARPSRGAALTQEGSMGLLKIDNVTHWSIPVNNLAESEQFYQDVLGLEYQGRLGNSNMACFTVAEHSILLCQRKEPLVRTPEQDNRLHHSFTVNSVVFEKACQVFRAQGIRVVDLIYREHGFFPGRELYFLDPSGNVLELRDPTWQAGMPTPTYEELARS
jgi:catechol 2,3-dioxygenase-like lactoylglutathione lyase family enzyme